jgi:hypothetical protein
MMMMKGEESEEMKTRCELQEKRAIHLNRKRCNMRYKINTGNIRRIRKSISCLVSIRKGYGRICRGTYWAQSRKDKTKRRTRTKMVSR